MVAACGGVVQIPEDDQRPVLAVPIEDGVGVDPDGGRLRRAAEQRVGTEPGPLVLVVGGEPATGEGQQLGLQVHRDKVPVRSVDVDSQVHRAAARDRAGIGRCVALLDRPQTSGEVDDFGGRHGWQGGDEPDPDPTDILVGGQHRVPGSAQQGHHVGQRFGLADLLHREDIRGEAGDGGREGGQFLLLRRLGFRSELAARPVQVLQVPGPDGNHHARQGPGAG